MTKKSVLSKPCGGGQFFAYHASAVARVLAVIDTPLPVVRVNGQFDLARLMRQLTARQFRVLRDDRIASIDELHLIDPTTGVPEIFFAPAKGDYGLKNTH
jgi:hypothetical protein